MYDVYGVEICRYESMVQIVTHNHTREGKEMFYLTTHSTHFILRLYGIGHMVKDHSNSERGNPLPPLGLSFRLTARVLLYAPSYRRQDSTYHDLCYTSCGALAGTHNHTTPTEKKELAQKFHTIY